MVTTGGPSTRTDAVADGPAVTLAVTVCGPPETAPAVNRPAEEIDPPPVTVQDAVTGPPNAALNWSFALSVNAWVPFTSAVARSGEISSEVAVCSTTTATLLVVWRPVASSTVTVRL